MSEARHQHPQADDRSAGSDGRSAGPLLAIESSNPTAEPAAGCGAGVGLFVRAAGGVRCLARRSFAPGERQDDALLPMVEAVCQAAGVEAKELGGVAVSLGPGGYTACRIAATVAQCIGAARRIACYGVPSALALAHAEAVALAGNDERVRTLAVLLAWKRADVWRQVFARTDDAVRAEDAGQLVGIGEPLAGVNGPGIGLIADAATMERVRGALGDAAGGALDGVRVSPPRFDPASVAGVVLAGLVAAADPARVQPVYPRDPEAVTKWEALARARTKAAQRKG